MQKLPVIVSMGGISPAGLSSSHYGYRRLVIDALPEQEANQTWQHLACLTGIPVSAQNKLAAATLIRKLEKTLFNAEHVSHHVPIIPHESLKAQLNASHGQSNLPTDWIKQKMSNGKYEIDVPAKTQLLLHSQRKLAVQSAGQLPKGFCPGDLYQSRNHPRGLQITVFGASDAIAALGIDWETVRNAVRPDQIAVYASSALSQLDYCGFGGMLQSRLLGKRTTSKQLPLGLADMPANFINAYLLGNVGATGANLAACATFLYNLKFAMDDIRSGKRRVCFVGCAEAPITPEIIDGFSAMGALATAENLRKMDHLAIGEEPDFRRACRPFGDNCGFTLAESAQFTILMDESLALELGANILGSVSAIYVNADGFKKSITAPGIGNYLSMAKTLASMRSLFGKDALQRSYIHAHGTGTEQNRITESQILSRCAQVFGIERWAVAAVKSYLGHPLGSAAGDQLMATLGFWRFGIIPGICTIDKIADDVNKKQLDFLTQHKVCDTSDIDFTLINTKGFGGNNATGAIISPQKTQEMMRQRHGKKSMTQWLKKNARVQERTQSYSAACLRQTPRPIYHFGQDMLADEAVTMSTEEITLASFEKALSLNICNPYQDMVAKTD